jgi:hypothetical protein
MKRQMKREIIMATFLVTYALVSIALLAVEHNLVFMAGKRAKPEKTNSYSPW